MRSEDSSENKFITLYKIIKNEKYLTYKCGNCCNCLRYGQTIYVCNLLRLYKYLDKLMGVLFKLKEFDIIKIYFDARLNCHQRIFNNCVK